MYDQINKFSDTERLTDVFIALVKESASLNRENIQKVKSYVENLLKEQRVGEISIMQAEQKDTSVEEYHQSNPATRCAFCGRPDDQVQRMIQGPGICICDECVYLCLQVLLVPLN